MSLESIDFLKLLQCGFGLRGDLIVVHAANHFRLGALIRQILLIIIVIIIISVVGRSILCILMLSRRGKVLVFLKHLLNELVCAPLGLPRCQLWLL